MLFSWERLLSILAFTLLPTKAQISRCEHVLAVPTKFCLKKSFDPTTRVCLSLSQCRNNLHMVFYFGAAEWVFTGFYVYFTKAKANVINKNNYTYPYKLIKLVSLGKHKQIVEYAWSVLHTNLSCQMSICANIF